ncbi:MAG: hypothetical protein KJ077_10490 [Anaerolineae bacterium]|nr:hypothetical protein [Anaerolineae bacterium]
MSTMNRYATWFPTDGPGSLMDIFRPGGMSGADDPLGGRKVVYVNGPDGDFVPYGVEESPPGGQPDVNFTFFQEAEVNFLEQMAAKNKRFHAQKRFNPFSSIDNPHGWSRIWHLADGRATGKKMPEGPDLTANGALQRNEIRGTFFTVVDILKLALSALTTTEAENINCIAGLKEEHALEGTGYPGADKILYAGCNAGTGAKANVLYSKTGGGTWAAMANQPFANDEHISKIVMRPIAATKFRVIVACGSTAANVRVAYVDIDLGAEGAGTFTSVTIVAGAATVTALAWPEYNRVYAGLSDGKIYVSTTQGESWSLVHSGANQINAFARDRFGSVWAVGASNTILKESYNNRGVFTTKTGPSDGAASTAIALGYDGTILLGSGTKLYRNGNDAFNAGGWTTLKDFGSNKSPIAIELEGKAKLFDVGDTETFRIFVDDSTPGSGLVYESVEGGARFRQIETLTNVGYNGVYASKYGNHYVIVGDADTVGAIHLLKQG